MTLLPSYLQQQAYRSRLEQARQITAGQKRDEIGLTEFKRRMWPGYMHADHLEALDRALTDAALFAETRGREGHGFIIVSMPPRHGKSETTARNFPAWFLGRNPDMRVILTGYGADLVNEHSRAARNIIDSQEYQELFPGIELAADSHAANEWNISGRRGGMRAAGIGGGITGKGGNIIIIDDPVKSRKEAESVTYRKRVIKAFTDELYTRRAPGAAVIVVMTRWHQDDLAGYLLRTQPNKWREIRLAGIAGEDDPLGREPGEALWPEQYPIEALLDIKATMDSYSWAGLYDQNPVPAEGGLFKRDKVAILDIEPADIIRRARFWDLAMSEKTSADYTVGTLMGFTAGGVSVVLDVQRRQIDWDKVPGFIAEVAEIDGPQVPIGVETAFYQTKAVKILLKMPEMHRFSVKGYQPDADKFTRALPFAARWGNGLVVVMRRAWTETYIDEMCSFPSGVNDDQVDASSGGYQMLDGGRRKLEVTTSRVL